MPLSGDVYLDDQPCNAAAVRFEIGQSLEPAGGISCGGAQKLGKFVRGARCKTAVRTAREASDLAERLFADGLRAGNSAAPFD